MSEYQYYEFQALDRRLTQTEQAAIAELSSRVHLTATSASFVYNYSDLPASPEKVLEQYFDAMLYISNWGSRRLMFRFPIELLQVDAIKPYCVPFATTVMTTDKYALLDISYDKEEGEWIDSGEGLLTGMIGLRDAILRGDYRVLYLAWLRACSDQIDFDDEDEDDYEGEAINANTPEPPVPPGLQRLDAGLEAFIEFFEIDPLWVEAGAANSASIAEVTDPIEQWVQMLPEADCKRYLLRVMRGESNLAMQITSDLRRRFGAFGPTPRRPKSRTVRQLYAVVKKQQQRIAEEQRQAAELSRLKRLKALAAQEPAMWDRVTTHIHRRDSKGYRDAVSLLRELREVAEFQGTQTAFAAHIEQIRQQFSTLRSFLSLMNTAGLIKQ